ncbi:unnamed protein product [Caenorhabditis bovis]|uniref:Uncharacterized protein n=1 Tax=Caenorhabditis bovis TaxID=2654633 RepID=A0A8S1ETA5_9PELO|nr:unnamed protein product [Caenorhabditis bovis]
MVDGDSDAVDEATLVEKDDTTMTSIVGYSRDPLHKTVLEVLNILSLETIKAFPEKPLDDAKRKHIIHFARLLDRKTEQLGGEENTIEFEHNWSLLTWALLNVIARVNHEANPEISATLNHLLVALVNRAKPIRAPKLRAAGETLWLSFNQLYNQCLHILHNLYSQLDHSSADVASKLDEFCDSHLEPCLESFKQMCTNSADVLHTELRKKQVECIRDREHLADDDVTDIVHYYTSCLYILGLLAARLQGFQYECCSSIGYFFSRIDSMQRMMTMVVATYEQVMCDALMCMEPLTSPVLVTNNLFTFTCTPLARSLIFKNFEVQIVSEDTAQTIQEEITSVRCGLKSPLHPPVFPSAALLAMKPTSGVKRHNATASASGGNTAHKKSDVNSAESVSLVPTFSDITNSWTAQYPYLLCTTRQKDAELLDTRSSQIGKRPLFYFYIRARTFSPSGGLTNVRTLSLPFTISTRRNQDCQVQRMFSSYTATCFWLYGSCTVDGLFLNWNDDAIGWNTFRKLCSQYFTVNAEVSRRMEESDFDVLEEKMQCEDCDDHRRHPPMLPNGERRISFKNMLCPHLRFETDTTMMRFSVWRGILEMVQIFQETKTNVKMAWDDYLLHGFVDTSRIADLLGPYRNCLMVRLTYIIGGSLCVSYRNDGDVVHLEPIDLRKLQTKCILDYLADIAESAMIDYILMADMSVIAVSEMIVKYKIGQDVTRVRGVTCNISYSGPVTQVNHIKFTPLRVAVVTCKDGPVAMPTTPTRRQRSGREYFHLTINPFNTDPNAETIIKRCPPRYRRAPARKSKFKGNLLLNRRTTRRSTNSTRTTTSSAAQRAAAAPSAPQVSFEVQLASLMRMYGKTPTEVRKCLRFSGFYGSWAAYKQ